MRERGGVAAGFAVFIGCWLAAVTAAGEPAQGSLRLVVEPEHERIALGQPLRVTVGLRDAHDQPIPAPSAWAIAIALMPAVPGATPTVNIPAGQLAAVLELRPAKLGIFEIRATHPQAFAGSAFVRVTRRPPAAKRAPPADPVPAGTARDGSGAAPGGPSHATRSPAPPRPAPTASGASRGSAEPRAAAGSGRGVPASAGTSPVNGAAQTAVPEHAIRIDVGDADRDDKPAPAPPSATGSGAPTNPPPAAGSGAPLTAPRLELRYSPQRKLLADGRDLVTIHAFLSREDAEPEAAAAVRLTLFASAGTLEPRLVVIENGEGHATLTSDQAGDVTVELVRSQPRVELDGGAPLRIHFGAPIDGLRIEAKPAAISLVDETDLVVTLLDAGGRAVTTDEPRVVLLALDTGRGEIVQKALTIRPGEFEARTRLIATGVGEVAVSATSSSLRNQIARLDVRLPLGLLALSVTGGLIGGLLAFLRRRGTRWPRIGVGAVTGFLLYWAFMFGLMRIAPRGMVLNPLSNFALSAIGGWLGTEVFALLLTWLGIKQPRTRGGRGGGKHDAAGGDYEPAGGDHEPAARKAASGRS
jgi:hypothetical protein